jgi:hypothetical protein
MISTNKEAPIHAAPADDGLDDGQEDLGIKRLTKRSCGLAFSM